MTQRLYILGGSPCSGKSTVAALIAKRHNLTLFCADAGLERYMAMGACDGKPVCTALSGMSIEQAFMRDPARQCESELAFYREIFAYVLRDAAALPGIVLCEGAAFLPELCAGARYAALTPDEEFQVSHYRERGWAKELLAGFADGETAFSRWMARDALFAAAVRMQARAHSLPSIVNDGLLSVEELYAAVCAIFFGDKPDKR